MSFGTPLSCTPSAVMKTETHQEFTRPDRSRSQPLLLCMITQQLFLLSLLRRAYWILFTFLFVLLLKSVRRQRSHTPSQHIYTVAKYRCICLTLQCIFKLRFKNTDCAHHSLDFFLTCQKIHFRYERIASSIKNVI